MKRISLLLLLVLTAQSAFAFNDSSKADSVSELFKRGDKGAVTFQVDEEDFRHAFVNKLGERVLISGTVESRNKALEKKLRSRAKSENYDISKHSPLQFLKWFSADLKKHPEKYTANDLVAVYAMALTFDMLALAFEVNIESDPVKLSKAHLRLFLELAKSICHILELPDDYWKKLDGLQR